MDMVSLGRSICAGKNSDGQQSTDVLPAHVAYARKHIGTLEFPVLRYGLFYRALLLVRLLLLLCIAKADVCVCVCEREREREREVVWCVCVCAGSANTLYVQAGTTALKHIHAQNVA